MRRLPRNFHATDHHDADAPPHWVVLFPARTVMPFLRTPLGYEMVHPRHALTAAIALAFLPLVFWALYIGFTGKREPANLGHQVFMVFAGAYLVLSCILFARRAIDQRRGVEIHTREAGYSHLTWRTRLPVLLCEQLIVPAALALAGWGIAHSFSFELGWWLVACAASWLVMARWEYTRRLAQSRTTVDDMIRAQTFEARLDEHERQTRRRTAKAAPPAAPAYAQDDEPRMVRLGDDEELPARAPDMASWDEGNATVTPGRMSWIRRARRPARR